MALNLMKQSISVMQPTGVALGPALLLTAGTLGLMTAQERRGKRNKATKQGMCSSLSMIVFHDYNELPHAENCPMPQHLQEKVKLLSPDGEVSSVCRGVGANSLVQECAAPLEMAGGS